MKLRGAIFILWSAYLLPAQSSSPATLPNAEENSVTVEVVKKVEAGYPPDAVQRGLQGDVLINVAISLSGDVETTDIVNGDPILSKAALGAAKQWKFKAWKYMDLPIRSWATLAFDFKLPNASSGLPTAPGRLIESGGRGDPVWVSPPVIQAKLLKRVNPRYPRDAKKHRIQGTVVLQVGISKEGVVEDLQLESGPPELVEAAKDAVRQWKFQPFLLMGQPIRGRSKVVVNFALY